MTNKITQIKTGWACEKKNLRQMKTYTGICFKRTVRRYSLLSLPLSDWLI